MKVTESTKSTTIRSGSRGAQTLMRNARRVEQQQYSGYNGNYVSGSSSSSNNNQAANGYSANNNGAYNYNNNNNNNNNAGYYYGAGGDADRNEPWFLADYSLKMISCLQDERAINYERNEVEPSTVLFRLCPKDTCGASNSTSDGCDAGYGDFAIGINSFVQAYAESVKDDYTSALAVYSYGYEVFNVEEYARECKLYEGNKENGQDNNANGYSSVYAYLGLACTEDGKDIRMASFSDPYCSQESTDDAFSQLANGLQLPFSEGGMIPDTCMSCLSMNDNYEYEVSEMCKKTYEDASVRCEDSMESYNSYYGADTRGCEYLNKKLPSSALVKTNKGSSSSNIFANQSDQAKEIEGLLALFIIAGVVGAAFALFLGKKTFDTVKQRKLEKEQTAEGKDGILGEGSPAAGVVTSTIGFLQESSKVVKDSVQSLIEKVGGKDESAKSIEEAGYVSADGTIASA